jgi:hypothetical protein
MAVRAAIHDWLSSCEPGKTVMRHRLLRSKSNCSLACGLIGGLEMPKYVIEREIPDAGNLSDTELKEISQKSLTVLRGMGPQIQWLQSYVTGDRIYCVYLAPDEAMIRAHAKQGGFPANRVSAVRRVIDPTTAD